ncbi:hypothetical protein [Myceligenerans cantabricum]
MSDERQVTSDDAGDDGRIERLRELLTAPIKIPESESSGEQPDGGDGAQDAAAEEYPAPSVDIPPHVRAAAEAAAHAGEDEPRRTRTGKKRRTWADAFLDTGKRDLPADGGDAAAQLLARLDELDRRVGEEVARTRATADDAAEAAEAVRRDLGTARTEAQESAEAATARIDAADQVATETAGNLDGLRGNLDGLREKVDGLREKVDGLDGTAKEQRDEISRLTSSLATARDETSAAARRAGTATVVAVVAVVLALVAVVAAFLV